jgi:hypothetical protein
MSDYDNIILNTSEYDDIMSGCIDTSALTSSILGPFPNYNIGIGTTPGLNGSFNYATNGTYTLAPPTQSGLFVKGDADFEGDVTIKGVSLVKMLEDIQKRLAILVPDPAKLEHFAALKKAYDHYKVLEALCDLPITTKE